jgi:hypothetical protein
MRLFIIIATLGIVLSAKADDIKCMSLTGYLRAGGYYLVLESDPSDLKGRCVHFDSSSVEGLELKGTDSSQDKTYFSFESALINRNFACYYEDNRGETEYASFSHCDANSLTENIEYYIPKNYCRDGKTEYVRQNSLTVQDGKIHINSNDRKSSHYRHLVLGYWGRTSCK